MWPFSTPPELPQEIRDYYAEQDAGARARAAASDERAAKVQRALASQGFSHEFEKHKREHTLRKVVAINCAEVQMAVAQCHRGWLLLETGSCADEMRRSAACLDLQTRALKHLHYNECHEERQCRRIRLLVDRLFVTHCGQLGEKVSAESESRFDAAVDAAFDRVW